MPNYVEPMPEGLVRQRRNLIIACSVVLFFQVGNVSVNSMSYSELNIQIGNQSSVYLAIWTFFFYSLMRFFVYFVQDGWDSLKFTFVHAIDDSCLTELTSFAEKHSGNSLKSNDGLVISESKLSAFHVEFNIPGEPDAKLNVLWISLVPCMLKGCVSFLFFRTATTDYIFPFVLALYVFFVSGFSDWKGSIPKLLGAEL